MAGGDGYGKRLAALRMSRGMSQRELGEAVGVHGAYLSRIERGDRPKASEKVTRALARALGVPIADLDPDLEATDETAGTRVVELEERVRVMDARLARVEDALRRVSEALS